MRAMIFDGPGRPLRLATVATPSPGPDQVLLHVHACGICRTDLHIVDGEGKEPKLPLILGHQIVGTIVAKGERVERFLAGERVGVPWLGPTCNHCRYCLSGRENLCDKAQFTGYQRDGGFAE
jgi:alcohol dehydrogenase, propanol-preferring